GDRGLQERERRRALAMEKIIHGNPVLGAGELERVSRVQDQLVNLLRERTGRQSPTDPGPVAIAGAALSCLVAAKTTWITTSQSRPFRRTARPSHGHPQTGIDADSSNDN